MPIGCNIHPWMGARVGIFDHPYFAVTDDDGAFTIKLAPAGAVRFFGYHEKLALFGGAKGRNGFPHNVPAGDVLDLGELKMQE